MALAQIGLASAAMQTEVFEAVALSVPDVSTGSGGSPAQQSDSAPKKFGERPNPLEVRTLVPLWHPATQCGHGGVAQLCFSEIL